MANESNVFDHIKYYSLPFEEKFIMVRYGKHLDVFKNDPDPTISELAHMILEHTKDGIKYPVSVTLKDDLK